MNPVVCFGEALIDFLHTGSEQVDALCLPEFRQFPGGAPANAAVAVAKLGGNAYFAGQVGNDTFGQFLKLSLHAYGVNTQFVHTHPSAKTAMAFVHLDDAGDRSFSFYRQNSADMLFKTSQVDAQWFKPTSLFHLCSNTLTADDIAQCSKFALEQALANQALVSFDVNLRHNLWPQGCANKSLVNELVFQSHMVKFAKQELDYLSDNQPQAYIQQAHSNQCQLVIVTDGGNDIYYYTKTHNGSITPPKVNVVDTTAGGDGFIGAMLYGLSQFADPKSILNRADIVAGLIECASACGAFAVSKPGAFVALATKDDALNLPQPFSEIIEGLKQKEAV